MFICVSVILGPPTPSVNPILISQHLGPHLNQSTLEFVHTFFCEVTDMQNAVPSVLFSFQLWKKVSFPNGDYSEKKTKQRKKKQKNPKKPKTQPPLPVKHGLDPRACAL